MKFPLKLALKPGLKWSGHLTVMDKVAETYAVAFDAEDLSSPHERYVFDRTVMSAEKLEEWTGWREGYAYCPRCDRILAEGLEEWDDSLEALCFGESDPLCERSAKAVKRSPAARTR